MKQAENIFLIVVTAIIGFSVIAYNATGWLLPDAVEVAEVSDLENRYYAEAPGFSAEAVVDRGFQDGLEQFVADHVPGRDQAVCLNAGLQRTCIAAAAATCGYDVYPTFFGSRYYAVPGDGVIVERAEEAPADGGGAVLDAWVATLNSAAAAHPDTRFVYDCIVRHDQSEANPTYRHFQNRLNAEWAQANILQRLDPSIDAFVDGVASYDEIRDEWFATDCHWTLKRALKSYGLLTERLSLRRYPYENPVQVTDAWQGSYAHSGLDFDYPIALYDLPVDFSYLSYVELPEFGGNERTVGTRESVLSGEAEMEPGLNSKYYEYFGGGDMVIENHGKSNGKTAVLVCDSLSYCLQRFIASNYSRTVVLMPGNSRLEGSFEDYLAQYEPDDVIIMIHASKYQTFADYSPGFIGL